MTKVFIGGISTVDMLECDRDDNPARNQSLYEHAEGTCGAVFGSYAEAFSTLMGELQDEAEYVELTSVHEKTKTSEQDHERAFSFHAVKTWTTEIFATDPAAENEQEPELWAVIVIREFRINE